MTNRSHINVNNYDSHLLITGVDQSNLVDHVPAMVYRARMSREGLILIKDRPNFKVPQLRFGKHNRYFSTITGSYDPLGASLGVLLHGVKGTGKSLMAEEIGNWMIRRDLPVILIDDSLSPSFINMILSAVGPCMMLFDEFGKVYSDLEERARLLTIFSDTSFVGVIFAITGNSPEEFSDFLLHRPQRFRFSIHYSGGLDTETVEDILKKMQVREEMHDCLRAYAEAYCNTLNIDSFLAVVRESANCRTTTELEEVTEIMNIPSFVKKEWCVARVDATPKHERSAEFGYSVNFAEHFKGGSGKALRFVETRNMGRSWEKDSEGLVSEMTLEDLENKQVFVVTQDGKHYNFTVHLEYSYGHRHRQMSHRRVGADHPDLERLEAEHMARSGSPNPRARHNQFSDEQNMFSAETIHSYK